MLPKDLSCLSHESAFVTKLCRCNLFFTKFAAKFSLLRLLFNLWVKETLGKTTALSEEGDEGEGPLKFNAGSVLIGKLSTAHFDFLRVREEDT